MGVLNEPQYEPPHDCGLCDGRLVFDGHTVDGVALWHCVDCGWRHVSTDCCGDACRAVVRHEVTEPGGTP